MEGRTDASRGEKGWINIEEGRFIGRILQVGLVFDFRYDNNNYYYSILFFKYQT